ncbi:uncharacterized protein EI97DRAFT_372292 [Westerdykella ornata]|uniref:Uncharacterized protein n=1 Tax=Westerdykella ornata TaxID=318751 RepID=A0A6A6JUP3_WESOR|nr:uncharacterized protein EI97DRAFT_372292 [Westerdykella ornata]KAF2278759.1 hypothetical protein EI97DRAFT_372292 [Westerdykella ornata]
MDSPVASCDAGAVPSRLQVALAISILQHKPDSVTVRADYILQLRDHLGRGKQSFANHETHHRHLDQVAYWKAQYDASQRRCEELEHRILQLERRISSDATSTDLHTILDPDSFPAQSKRKRTASRSARTPKRAKKPALDTEQGCPNSDKVQPPATELGEVDKAKEHLCQKVYLSHKLCNQHPVDREGLCFALMDTARAIGSIIALALRNHDRLANEFRNGTTPIEKDKSELASIIQASTRAWASLLVGLKRLVDVGGNHLPGLVTFQCVKAINGILESISDYAQQVAGARCPAPSNHNRDRNQGNAPPRDTAPFRTMSQFINALMGSLSKDDKHHRDIFEGVLFHILQRVGQLLFYFTFDTHRSTTIEGDIIASQPKDEKTALARGLTNATVARLQAQCLITILDRALGLAPYHMNAPLPSRPSTPTGRRSSTAGRSTTLKALPRASTAPLATHARDRLQRTLLVGTFGEGEDDEFADVLRRPGLLGPLPKAPKIADDDVGDWFKLEVWRLVGWDLLCRETEW